MSNNDSSLYVRGAPPGPEGLGGEHRRCARRTASRQRVSRCGVFTKVRAPICKAGPSRACSRWYAGGTRRDTKSHVRSSACALSPVSGAVSKGARHFFAERYLEEK